MYIHKGKNEIYDMDIECVGTIEVGRLCCHVLSLLLQYS